MKINTYPSPWDLRYFQELALTENISRAAERLAIAQPTLSLSLKRLEDSLQVKLFYRRNRGLVLTPSGQRLLRECNQLLNYWNNIVSETRKSKNEIKGLFTIGCHATVGIYSLNPLLKNLYSHFPGIEIQLKHGLSRVICERVITNQIDFGIVVNPVIHPDLVLNKLGHDEVCYWQTPQTIADVLIYNPDLIQSQSMLKKLKSKKFTRTIKTESLELIAVLAKSGAGTAILPSRVVHALAPGLQKIHQLPTFIDDIYFIYRSDLPKTPASKVLIESIKNIKI